MVTTFAFLITRSAVTAGRKGAEVSRCAESEISQAGRVKSRARIVVEITVANFGLLNIVGLSY